MAQHPSMSLAKYAITAVACVGIMWALAWCTVRATEAERTAPQFDAWRQKCIANCDARATGAE